MDPKDIAREIIHHMGPDHDLQSFYNLASQMYGQRNLEMIVEGLNNLRNEGEIRIGLIQRTDEGGVRRSFIGIIPLADDSNSNPGIVVR